MKRVSLLLLIVFALQLLAHGDAMNVSLNTSSISGQTFTLAFQFTDGSGSTPADANNSVTISGLSFGGGSVAGAPTFTGSGASSTASGLVLTDSDFFNSVEEQFVAGNVLSFTFDLTSNPDLLAPDEFAFSIEEIGTTDAVGGAFLVADVGSAPVTYSAVSPYESIGSPTLSSASSTVPETSSLLLISSGLVGLKLPYARRRKDTIKK